MTPAWTLPAGRELDAIVATLVMGEDVESKPEHAWKRLPDGKVDWNAWKDNDGDHPNGAECERCEEMLCELCSTNKDRALAGHCVPYAAVYSTSILFAWDVVEKLRVPYLSRWGDTGHWTCKCWTDAGPVEATAETAPLAICRAALKAVAEQQK